jgi:trigger factor
MSVAVENLGGRKVRLTVEIDAETLRQRKMKLAKAYGARMNVRGFRPGKAPIEFVLRQIGDALEAELRQLLIEESFDEGLKSANLKPSTEPRFEFGEAQADGALRFTCEFEAYPVIDPKDYLGMEVEAPDMPEIVDSEVDAMVERLRTQSAKWETRPTGEEAHESDLAKCSVTIRDAETGETVQTDEESRIVVGLSDYPVEGIGRALLGVKAGEERGVTWGLKQPKAEDGSEVPDRQVTVTATVKDLMFKVIPALDDDFAKRFGPDMTVETLREKAREGMERGRQERIKEQIKERLLDRLLELNPVELGDGTVTRVADITEAEVKDRLLGDASDEEKAKFDLGIPKEKTEAQARRTLGRQLLLHAIADKEGIEISDEEFGERLAVIASESRMPLPKVRARMAGEEGERLRASMRLQKAEDMMVRYAVLKPASSPEPASDPAPEPVPEPAPVPEPEEARK